MARLTEWGVDWHGIRMEKGKADVYVDDKGTTPSDELTAEGYDGDGELDQSETQGDSTDPQRGDVQDAQGEVDDDAETSRSEQAEGAE